MLTHKTDARKDRQTRLTPVAQRVQKIYLVIGILTILVAFILGRHSADSCYEMSFITCSVLNTIFYLPSFYLVLLSTIFFFLAKQNGSRPAKYGQAISTFMIMAACFCMILVALAFGLLSSLRGP